MSIVINTIIYAIAIGISAAILPGVAVGNAWSAVLTAIILGIINAFLKPILMALALPLNVFTFGLFTLVINALLIMLASAIVPGFKVDNFWWALLFGIILSIISGILFGIAY